MMALVLLPLIERQDRFGRVCAESLLPFVVGCDMSFCYRLHVHLDGWKGDRELVRQSAQ